MKNSKQIDEKSATGSDGDLEDVESLAKRIPVNNALLSGLMEFRGWRSGKQVSEDEFRQALQEFLNCRAG